jgi:hypothetical protein
MRQTHLTPIDEMSSNRSSARGLYEKFGFRSPATPENFMEIHRPDIYR